MVMQFQNRLFETTLCSDNEPDSMYLEVVERRDGKTIVVLEIRHFEDTGIITFTALEQDLPFELIEHFGRSARVSLTPMLTVAQ